MSQDVQGEESLDTLKITGEKSDKALETEAEAKVLRNYLEKSYEGIGKVRIHHSSLDTDAEVDDIYTETFNRLLMDSDLPTEKRMERILEEKGAWTEEDENEIEFIISSINNLQLNSAEIRRKVKARKSNKVNKAETVKFRELSEEILKLNNKLILLTIRKSKLFEGTIEKRAERYAILHKLTKCVKNTKDEPLWADTSEVGKVRGTVIKRLAADAMRFWNGVDSNLSDALLDQVSSS